MYKDSKLRQELDVGGGEVIIKEKEQRLVIVFADNTTAVSTEQPSSPEDSEEFGGTISTSPSVLQEYILLANPEEMTMSPPALKYKRAPR
jgi:hypothetical protein